MTCRLGGVLLFFAWSLVSFSVSKADEPAEVPLPLQAKKVLARYCYDCHGRGGSHEGGMDYISDLGRLVKAGKVAPKDWSHSKLAVRMLSKEEPMPPTDKADRPRPTEQEIAVLKAWIESGAQPVEEVAAQLQPRKYISNTAVISVIHDHLAHLQPEDRPFQRYFTLHHLHNLPSVTDDRLRLVRAAVVKTLNSLSWRPEIVVPRPIDADQTVLAFDLRDVDWDADHVRRKYDLWSYLAAAYPYALKHDRFPDQVFTRDWAKEIYQWTNFDVPWIRADWFVANATQPPLYHTLLYDAVFPELAKREKVKVKLPNGTEQLEPAMTAEDLEGWLRVDVSANVRRDKAARAGITQSAISAQPRVLERHPALYGAYSKSYDFKPGNDTLNIFKYPLGPVGALHDDKFKPFEFRQDGGEIIFNLPNGLQGYLLVDGRGYRINAAPTEVVAFKDGPLATVAVVDGLSCIACHKQGVKRVTDQVRLGAAGLQFTAARDKVRRLYLDPADWNQLLDKDEVRFLRALEECLGPTLRNGPEDTRKTGDFDEPIAPVAKAMLVAEMGSDELAAELYLPNRGLLDGAIGFNPALQNLGLTALPAGGKIKREILEAGSGSSLYQKAAVQLYIGTPVKVTLPSDAILYK